MGRTPAAEWAGPAAMPGNYTLHLGVYDPQGDVAGLDVLGANGVPLGKRATLTLTLPTPTPAQAIPQPWTEIAPGVELAASLDAATAEPGQRLLLTLHWRTTDSVALPAQVTATWPGVRASQPGPGSVRPNLAIGDHSAHGPQPDRAAASPPAQSF